MAFSVLTAAQGATLRRRIGDKTYEELTDTELDAIYTAAGLDLDLATVNAIQELMGIYAMHVNISDPQGDVSEERGQRFKNLQDLLRYWEDTIGTSGTALALGTLETGLDYESDT